MRNQYQIGRREKVSSRPGTRPTVVVADDGVSANLVILEDDRSPDPGVCFTHRGREWRIRGPRHGSRVVVAVPVDAPKH